MSFSIFSIENNKITNLQGIQSFFYELFPQDIEQMSGLTLENYYDELKKSLMNLPEDSFVKLYKRNRKIFINSEKENLELPFKITSKENPMGTILEELNYSDIIFKEDYFLFNSNAYRVVTLKEHFAEVGLAELHHLEHDLVVSFKRSSLIKDKLKLNKKRKMFLTTLGKNIRDIESESAYSTSEEILEKISSGEECLFEAKVSFIVKSSSKEDLDLKTKELAKKVELKGGQLFSNYEQSIELNRILPGVSPSFTAKEITTADYLTSLLPIHVDKIHKSGIKFQSSSGAKVYFDVFSNKNHNYNLLLSGPSGQGKSMLANKITKESLDNKAKVFIIDLGNSFKKTAEYYSGEILSESFNPVQFKDPIYLHEFILSVIGQHLNDMDKGELLRDIKEFTEEKANFSFNDLLERLDKPYRRVKDAFFELMPYFNDETHELKNLTYVDLTKYPKRVKAPLVVYTLEYFKNLEGKKALIIDEAWDLLKGHADFISECFRTFRKQNASAIAISQNLEEFLNTELGLVIFKSSYFKVVFRQTIDRNQHLDSEVSDIIKSLKSVRGKYSEFLLLSEDIRKVVRYVPTNKEYELFNSSPDENLRLINFINKNEEFWSFKDAFDRYTRLKYYEASI